MRLVLAVVLTTVWTFSCLAAGGESAGSPAKLLPAEAPRVTLRSVCCADGPCWIADSANFRIQWRASEAEVRALAAACERLAGQLKAAWLGGIPSSRWLPQCEVVVHPDTSSYVAFLGPRSAQTSGCATIRIDQGRIVSRRIDLCAEALDWKTESLPHELTHVVLADRFATRRIAPWADEGIAMLSESPRKRGRRLAALRRAAGIGPTYSVRDLMAVQTFPEPELRNAFYGQSVALVSLLLKWGTPGQLLQFVETSQSAGADAAFASVYGNRPIADLERQLGQSLLSER